MEKINFEDFKKIEIKIGKIINAEQIENSEKLLKLEVDFGPENEKRQIIAGIGKFYSAKELMGKLCPFVYNLEPKMINGTESQGMILCADDGGPVIILPDKEISPGSIVK